MIHQGMLYFADVLFYDNDPPRYVIFWQNNLLITIEITKNQELEAPILCNHAK
jgi:hypothetical protein